MPSLRAVLLPLLGGWAAIAAWNGLKPLPAGMHVTSLPWRLTDSQLTLVHAGADRGPLALELAAVDGAGEFILLDGAPLPRELAQHLLLKRRERPGVPIVLLSDPRSEEYGGTPAEYLESLERAGVIVVRVRLDRLRDATPLYSGLWRLALGWWSDRYDESPLRAALRARNGKADRRNLLVSDDGTGGWRSILPATGARGLTIEIQGRLARDIAASELAVAAWSSDDERLPAAPRPETGGIGSIDARYLTEGAIRAAILDALESAGPGDRIDVAARALSDRRLIDAFEGAAGRGARLRLLLDPEVEPNVAVAGELRHDGTIEVRWAPRAAPVLLLIQRHRETWAHLGCADLTRTSLGDFDLTSDIELRLPTGAPASRMLENSFAASWAAAMPYQWHADASWSDYWRYRLMQAAALAAY